MNPSFEQTLVDVWQQTLVENAEVIVLGAELYLVRRTPKRPACGRWISCSMGTRFVDWNRNPETKSRWAQIAGSGKKVMQFLSEGRYLANVVDGKVNFYGGKS